MGEAPQRLTDAHGHKWPVTGYWCDVCGMPLHPTLRAVGVHLNCEVQQAGTGPASVEAESDNG